MKKLTRKIVALTLSLVMCISFSSYDATEDATTFYFTEDTYEENIGWKFAGNLLDQYSAGDVLNLTFDVLNVGNYQGITFESLDYFEAAYAHNNGAAYPNIQDYQ